MATNGKRRSSTWSNPKNVPDEENKRIDMPMLDSGIGHILDVGLADEVLELLVTP